MKQEKAKNIDSQCEKDLRAAPESFSRTWLRNLDTRVFHITATWQNIQLLYT